MIDLLISAALGAVLLLGCLLLLAVSIVPALCEARRLLADIADAVRARRGKPEPPNPADDRGER